MIDDRQPAAAAATSKLEGKSDAPVIVLVLMIEGIAGGLCRPFACTQLLEPR